jgi:hypothetical protein
MQKVSLDGWMWDVWAAREDQPIHPTSTHYYFDPNILPNLNPDVLQKCALMVENV